MLSSEDVQELLQRFPKVEYAFAYGSGAVEQIGYNYAVASEELPMLDLVFVVDDSAAWHAENMQINAEHYSTLFSMSPTMIARIQDDYGAGMWYNPYVRMGTSRYPNRLMKYGVISKTNFIADLMQWTSLYVAGRLHKPVVVLKENIELQAMIGMNKLRALRTALLLLPNQFSRTDLYMKIASLSYTGDPRMLFGGENPKKVRNLVAPAIPQYERLYESTFLSIRDFAGIEADGSLHMQNLDAQKRWELCVGLPKMVRQALKISRQGLPKEKVPPSKFALQLALASIVARSSTVQTAKGLLTAGVTKSTSYIIAKLQKGVLKRFVR
jgi:translocator assembly and maintenance protein 41